MSQENLDVIRDQYDAVNERDWVRAMAHYAHDVELVIPKGIRGGTFRGREAVGDWFGDWFGTFDRDLRFDITDIAELEGGDILVVADHRARGRGSGVELEDQVVWVYRLRDRKITRVEGFDSRAEALAATKAQG